MKSEQKQYDEFDLLVEYRNDCERFVLGNAILERSMLALISSIVHPKDFVDPAVGKLYGIIEMMNGANEPIPAHAVLLAAKKAELFEMLGGLSKYGAIADFSEINN